jgi:hypothetical protein
VTEQDGTRLGYLEPVLEGFIVEAAAEVERLTLIFDSLRSEALPRSMSRALIEKAANQSW